jgi:hypothetical protein
MTELRRILDRLVPEPAADGDWEQVLVDAERPRRILAFALPVAVAATLGAIVALAWPFASEPPPVLVRALAAIGDGPVIHVVTRGERGGWFVDLSTGTVTPLLDESEVWYDPSRGIHRVGRLGDHVTTDTLISSGRAARAVEEYLSLVNRYRDELKSGKAKVVARGRVNGRLVLWIRLDGEWRSGNGDGRLHLFAREVAVDRETFEPVYARHTRDGRPEPTSEGTLFLEVETLPAGDGDFTVDEAAGRRGPIHAGAELARHLPRSDLGRLFGRPAIWLGPAYRGKPLAETRELLFKHKEHPDDEWQVVRGATLFYGQLRPRRFGVQLRDDTKPYVLLTQAMKVSPIWLTAANAVDIPEGSVQIDAKGAALVRVAGVYVSVNAKPIADALEAAAALRAVGADAPPPRQFDFERITRELEGRKAHRVVTTGMSPVRSRPLIKPGAKVVQRGSGGGVSVRLYRTGVAVFDTTRMSPSLRKLLPEKVSVGCIKVSGSRGSIGGILVPFRRRITVPLLGHYRRGQPPRPIPPPFDACELGTGLGRNWFPRFNWHGALEIPLTDRGRRFFEERAVARKRAAAGRRR